MNTLNLHSKKEKEKKHELKYKKTNSLSFFLHIYLRRQLFFLFYYESWHICNNTNYEIQSHIFKYQVNNL